jgi:hypothetical protein
VVHGKMIFKESNCLFLFCFLSLIFYVMIYDCEDDLEEGWDIIQMVFWCSQLGLLVFMGTGGPTLLY